MLLDKGVAETYDIQSWPAPRLSGRLRVAVLGSACLAIVLMVVAARNRTPWSDEGQFSDAAYRLAKHGIFGASVFDTPGNRSRGFNSGSHTYWTMPLFPLGEALWYRVFPADLTWTRLYAMLWAPVALFAYYTFLARLSLDAVFAAVATVMLSLSYVFIDNAAFARPDIMCCALGLSGLASFLVLRERSFKLALLVADSFIAGSMMTHPNAIFHFASLVVLVLWLDRRRLNWTSLAIAGAPYVIALTAWGLYAMQDPTGFYHQLWANATQWKHGPDRRWTGTLNPLLILRNEVRERYFSAFGFLSDGIIRLKAVALVAYILGIAGAVSTRELRRRRDVRILLTLLCVCFIGMCVFNQKLTYYLVHITPFYIALLAVWSMWAWRKHPRLRWVAAAALTGLIAVECGGIWLKARKRSYARLELPAVAFLRSHTGPGDRIVGTSALTFALGFDGRLRDDLSLEIGSSEIPTAIVIEPIYRSIYDDWKRQRPAEMRLIQDRLSQYHLAYNNGEYEIYLRGR